MTRDREIAEAISEGINCIHAIVMALRAGTSPTPDPAWLSTLQEMVRALDAVRANEVMTSMVVSDEELSRVRNVSVLVADWTTAGRPPSELETAAAAVLGLLGIQV